MSISRYQKKNGGFSLLELALVVLIIGLLFVGLLGPISTGVEQRRRVQMQEQYKELRYVLLGFAVYHHRLPCPDCMDDSQAACSTNGNQPSDGLEDRDGDGCAVGSGNTLDGYLPGATLGLRALDPWGNRLRYHVDADYANEDYDNEQQNGLCLEPTGSFSICSQADIEVQDRGETCVSTEPAKSIASDIPVLVYSPGRRADIDGSCNELENMNGDEVFVDTNYSENDTTYYDDMIMWLSPYLLGSWMVRAEKLP